MCSRSLAFLRNLKSITQSSCPLVVWIRFRYSCVLRDLFAFLRNLKIRFGILTSWHCIWDFILRISCVLVLGCVCEKVFRNFFLTCVVLCLPRSVGCWCAWQQVWLVGWHIFWSSGGQKIPRPNRPRPGYHSTSHQIIRLGFHSLVGWVGLARIFSFRSKTLLGLTGLGQQILHSCELEVGLLVCAGGHGTYGPATSWWQLLAGPYCSA